MADVKEETSKARDPYEPFRQMRDAYLDAMSKTMVDAVNSESYAQVTGAMLDSYLTASAPFREVMEKSMLQGLQQLSLPSRQDIIALAERMSHLELRVDDLDAKLERILAVVTKLRAAPVPGNRPEDRGRAAKRAH